MADENDWVGNENARIEKRREALGVAPPEVAGDAGRAPGAWGLALSGGGIRSATFALGVLQALAQAELDDAKGRRTAWLRCFDYLSTVSGGGYAGAFFASLFQPRRLEPPPRKAPSLGQALARMLPRGMRGKLGLAKAPPAPQEKTKAEACREAAEMAYTVLEDDPPGRVRSRDAYDWKRRPLAWLRENGRYLTPTGAGDYLYAAGLAIRNWCSVHYVIGTALALLFALAALLKSSAALAQPWLAALFGAPRGFDFFAWRAWAIPDPSAWALWWSPLWVLPLAVFALWEAPSGIAFWLAATREGGAAPGRLARTFTLQAGMALAIALVLARLPITLAKLPTPLAGEGLRQLETGAWLLAALVLIALLFHAGAALAAESADEQRVRQTRALAAGLGLMLALAALALLDTLAQTFYFWLSHADSVLWRVLTPGALVGALVWAVRKLAAGPRGKALLPAWLPLSALAAAGAALLFAAVATAWAMLVQWLLWGLGPSEIVNADVLAAQYPGTLFLVALALLPTLVNGLFPDFINLSTLQAFYSARLTRAYLGASNGARFCGADARRYASAAEPHPDDPIARAAYFDPDVLAPLHLINVTLDLTVDPTEQLVQRDRKGLPLAVGPAGYLLDGAYAPHWSGRGDYPIGEWIGVSGAAFTTGLGRATTLGLALLLGLANVRLGVWWRSKLGADELRRGIEWLALKVFPTQTYLGYELSARFHGAHRARQYLSDGGHFENTAAYELLRPERELSVIVVCDDGCDPEYRFADLANLFRLARIDHQARFRLVTDFDPALGAIFGRDDDFAKKDLGALNKCALLYRVSYPQGRGRARWLIVLKPRLIADAPLDVWQYKQEHGGFPQETTTDQFFDEAQWESYRTLGLEIGTLVFGGANGARLIERLKQAP